MKVGGPKPHTHLLQYGKTYCKLTTRRSRGHYERSRNEDEANMQALREKTNKVYRYRPHRSLIHSRAKSTAHADPPELWSSKTRTLPPECLFPVILDLVMLLHPLVASAISTITHQAQMSASGMASIYRHPIDPAVVVHTFIVSRTPTSRARWAQRSNYWANLCFLLTHSISTLWQHRRRIASRYRPPRFPILQGGIIWHPYRSVRHISTSLPSAEVFSSSLLSNALFCSSRDQAFSITPPLSPLE
ncbi:hypothetical protein V8E53_009413 [Lactarius tabidus]